MAGETDPRGGVAGRYALVAARRRVRVLVAMVGWVNHVCVAARTVSDQSRWRHKVMGCGGNQEPGMGCRWHGSAGRTGNHRDGVLPSCPPVGTRCRIRMPSGVRRECSVRLYRRCLRYVVARARRQRCRQCHRYMRSEKVAVGQGRSSARLVQLMGWWWFQEPNRSNEPI